MYMRDVLNTSSPEDQQCETLSCEFLSRFIIILYLKNIALYFHALSAVKISCIEDTFSVQF